MILYLLAVYVMLYFFIHAGLRFKGYLCFLLRDKLTLLVRPCGKVYLTVSYL